MDTILIATDFSGASKNAVLYGLQLAEALNAKAILVNAYRVPAAPPTIFANISRYDVMQQMQYQLDEEVTTLSNRTNRVIKTVCEEGEPTAVILKIAAEQKADIIIAGMQGKGKNIHKIFGSTCISLSRKTCIPLLIVPEYAVYKKPEHIVFASDNYCSDLIIPKQLLNAARHFASRVCLVRVMKSEQYEWFELGDILQNKKTDIPFLERTFEYPPGSDIVSTLNEFLKSHMTDMLVMLPHKHYWVERLFIKSATKEMMFQTSIPLLLIPENLHELTETGKDIEKEVLC